MEDNSYYQKKTKDQYLHYQSHKDNRAAQIYCLLARCISHYRRPGALRDEADNITHDEDLCEPSGPDERVRSAACCAHNAA